MIVYPDGWQKIGQAISLKEIEDKLFQVLSEIKCNCIAFSGGLDSSLLLYFMAKTHKNVKAFTMGLSKNHPDILFSKLLIKNYRNVKHIIYIPTIEERAKEEKNVKFKGDDVVRLFYKFVSKHTDSIISGDGMDEFMCGYYAHQINPSEQTYYKYLRALQIEQLEPLDKNSRQIKVYLPYLDDRLIYIYSQIPIAKKVDEYGRKKIIQMIAKSKLPEGIIKRRKYGFCDVLRIKNNEL